MPDQDSWTSDLLKDPHHLPDKRRRVQTMFTAIAPSYDLNNRLHSLGADQRWRRKAARLAALKPRDRVVDVACGTGDLTRAFARAWPAPGPLPGHLLGIDFTFAMLPFARPKNPGALFVNGDAQALPLPAASADLLSIAFGIRNVADPLAALREFHRVLAPGGRLLILEFALPASPPLRLLYNLYFRRVLPFTATLLSGDRTGAYKYLPESVNTFISPDVMADLIQQAGFRDVKVHRFTFGVCLCYIASRP